LTQLLNPELEQSLKLWAFYPSLPPPPLPHPLRMAMQLRAMMLPQRQILLLWSLTPLNQSQVLPLPRPDFV
jgi:hypothetical protein